MSEQTLYGGMLVALVVIAGIAGATVASGHLLVAGVEVAATAAVGGTIHWLRGRTLDRVDRWRDRQRQAMKGLSR